MHPSKFLELLRRVDMVHISLLDLFHSFADLHLSAIECPESFA